METATTSLMYLVDGFFMWGFWLMPILVVPLMIYKFVFKPFQK